MSEECIIDLHLSCFSINFFFGYNCLVNFNSLFPWVPFHSCLIAFIIGDLEVVNLRDLQR